MQTHFPGYRDDTRETDDLGVTLCDGQLRPWEEIDDVAPECEACLDIQAVMNRKRAAEVADALKSFGVVAGRKAMGFASNLEFENWFIRNHASVVGPFCCGSAYGRLEMTADLIEGMRADFVEQGLIASV